MRKRIWLIIIICCVLVLFGLRFFPLEDTRICDGNTLVKHGNPSTDGSGFFCSGGTLTQSLLPTKYTTMKIVSDFQDNSLMSSQYTCDGEGRFPHLTVEDIPANTKTLVLIVDDPDAPGGTRDHLLLANISVEGVRVIISQNNFDSSVFGQNSRGELARGAPCPPNGTHRYIFKIYALSEVLEISSGFSKERLLELMGGKILGQSQLVGLYTRQ